MHRAQLTGEGGSHIGGHDVPVVIVEFLAVLAHEEDSLDAAGTQDTLELLDEFQVLLDMIALLIGQRLHVVVVIGQEGCRVVGIVGKRVAGHHRIKVHTRYPIAHEVKWATRGLTRACIQRQRQFRWDEAGVHTALDEIRDTSRWVSLVTGNREGAATVI